MQHALICHLCVYLSRQRSPALSAFVGAAESEIGMLLARAVSDSMVDHREILQLGLCILATSELLVLSSASNRRDMA